MELLCVCNYYKIMVQCSEHLSIHEMSLFITCTVFSCKKFSFLIFMYLLCVHARERRDEGWPCGQGSGLGPRRSGLEPCWGVNLPRTNVPCTKYLCGPCCCTL